MTHSFDKDYWDQHWQGDRSGAPAAMAVNRPNQHLVGVTDDLAPGTALDAGCGAGAEAIWLASRGWQVTGADIADQALARAADRAWVAPGGTLLIVGHLHHGHGHGRGLGGTEPPASASMTAADVRGRLDPSVWEVVTAEESRRTLSRHGHSAVTLHDVVVQATRRR